MYSCSFLSANKNTFEKNKKIQIRVKILPQNLFENTKTITFQILLIYIFIRLEKSFSYSFLNSMNYLCNNINFRGMTPVYLVY
jgi:hypothetical protein